MSTKARLEKLATVVVNNGLGSNTLQTELEKVANAHDLNSHEVARVAEMANRMAQMTMYKQASDKRAVFKLAEPGSIKTGAATYNTANEAQEKVAAILTSGDEYTVPVANDIYNLSIFNTPINTAVITEQKEAEFDAAVRELQKHAEYYNTLHNEAEEEKAKSKNRLEVTYKDTVDGAADMVLTGVTLPDMYLTITSAVNGAEATNEDKENAEKLALSIIKELKKRGIANHRMGFRTQEKKTDFDKLSAEELYALCKNCMGAERHVSKKIAEFEDKVKGRGKNPLALLEEAAEHLSKHKPGVNDGHIYMDDVKNYGPGEVPPIVNGESKFYIQVKDLVSEQARLTKLHGSSEYIGLRLKEIEDAVKGLKQERKEAFAVGPAISGAAKFLGTTAGTNAVSIGTTAVGLGGQALMQHSQNKVNKKMKQEAEGGTPSMNLSGGGQKVADAPAQPGLLGKAWNTLNSQGFTNVANIGLTTAQVGSQIWGQNKSTSDQRRLMREQHAYNMAERQGLYIRPDGTSVPIHPHTQPQQEEQPKAAGVYL